jgi:hypothetical protein
MGKERLGLPSKFIVSAPVDARGVVREISTGDTVAHRLESIHVEA